ncbi:TPA: hypothetical protein SHD29_001190 [Campylobacter coli]|nr:hypothetical protein [Campylobacter coli]
MPIPDLNSKIIRFLKDTYKNETYIYGVFGIYLKKHLSSLDENSSIEDICDIVGSIDKNKLNELYAVVKPQEDSTKFPKSIKSRIFKLICQEVNITENEMEAFSEHHKTNSIEIEL